MTKTILRRVVLAGLFVVPFIPFFVYSGYFFPFITTKAFAWRIAVEVVFGAWLVLALMDPEVRPRRSPLLWAFLAFMVVIGIADLAGVNPVKSFWSNYERMEGYVSLLHLGAFFLVAGSFMKEREWRWWWNTSLTASALMIFYCLSQILGATQIHQGGVRVDGTFGNAAYLAVYMLIHIFVALLFFLRTKRGNMLRWVYGALIFGQLVVLYYTATRGAILGLLGGLLLMALLNITNKESPRARKGSLAGIAAFFILVGAFFALRHTSFVQKSPVLSRFANVSAAELKTEGRSFIWPMALQGIKERPLLGWGQDNFNYIFDEHYSPKMYNLEPWFDRAHNIFLDWGVSGGILGLVSYLALYIFLLLAVWKDAGFSRVERSLLTALLAAYFFHNFFVFDNLGSYILFGALLAYMHTRSAKAPAAIGKTVDETTAAIYLVPVGLVILAILYFVNVKPMSANAELIQALQSTQSGTAGASQALGHFQAAYNGSRLGRPEVVEWIASSASGILSSGISDDEKKKYLEFAQTAVAKQAKDFGNDARYQLIAGSFFSTIGQSDQALSYLQSAEKLIPGKQEVYFELANNYIIKQDYKDALPYLKQAYDMAPDYKEAQILYLVGAIYNKDTQLANELVGLIPEETVVTDDRVANALYATGQYADLVTVLKKRVALKPDDAQSYASLALAYAKAGDKSDAILTLQALVAKHPEYKDQVEQFKKQIESGSF